MTGDAEVLVTVDRDAGAAYLRLSTNSVARTVESSEDVHVDLDVMGVVVGVELLDLMAPIPTDALASQHHIHSDAIRILAAAIQGQATPGTAFSEATRPRQAPFRTTTYRKLTSAS